MLHSDDVLGLVDTLFDLVLDMLLDFIDVRGVSPDVVVVDPGGAGGLRVEQQHQNGQLEHIVEGDEVENETRELIDHVEEAEDDPVGQPLSIVGLTIRLQRVEAHENGISHSQK